MFPVLCFGQYTSIPDSIFELCLINLGYDSIQDGQVLTANIVNVDTLFLANSPFGGIGVISDITGIEDFTNLTYLDCSGNHSFTNLDLSQNIQLNYLKCSGLDWGNLLIGNLTNLNVSQNSLLSYLNCSNNRIENLNLSQNVNLSYLNCSNNYLNQIDLSQNTALTHLNCSENFISNLDLSQNTALTDLYCQGSYYSGSTIMDGKLRNLDLRNNNNINMTNFKTNNNPLLYCINVDDSIWSDTNWGTGNSMNFNVDNHTIFSNNCNSIQYASIGYTAIMDAVFEGELISLGYDTVLDGQVLTTNISNVDSLDVSVSPRIYDLAGIEDFINLTYLNCSNNPLRYLDLTQNSFLTYLSCGGIPAGIMGGYGTLEDLNLPQNNTLSHLDCRINMLSNLDLSQNNALTYVDCGFSSSILGSFNNLDVSQNPNLTYLNCEFGSLTSLDVRNGNNINFTYFNAQVNLLDCISVDDSTWSASNWNNIDNYTSFSNNCVQYTLIPDSAFEQRLIDYGYDTIQDGKVLTSNISIIDSLDVSTPPNMFSPPKIYDLTGIESFSNLRFLNCAFNELTNLDLSQNSLLNNVMCGFNNIQNLNISQNINLEHLMCSHNPISNIDLTQNINLKTLNCGVMFINELDVSQNLNLDTIACGYNQISNLDLSNNQSLIALFCGFNQLESLDVRNGNNINFTDFEADNNDSLYCISVDDSAWSSNNWTNIDSHTNFSNDCNPSTTDIIEIEKNLLVYPNPTSEKINISVDNFNGNIQIEVYDLIGNNLQLTNETTLSLKGYSKGIYVLKVSYGDRVKEVKLIKD